MSPSERVMSADVSVAETFDMVNTVPSEPFTEKSSLPADFLPNTERLIVFPLEAVISPSFSPVQASALVNTVVSP